MQPQYRQGDVFLSGCPDVTDRNPTIIQPENGMVVVQKGVATGHHHQFKAGAEGNPAVVQYQLGDERFVQVKRRAILRHEEHDPISVPPGTYKVTIQTEYDPEGDRLVED